MIRILALAFILTACGGSEDIEPYSDCKVKHTRAECVQAIPCATYKESDPACKPGVSK